MYAFGTSPIQFFHLLCNILYYSTVNYATTLIFLYSSNIYDFYSTLDLTGPWTVLWTHNFSICALKENELIVLSFSLSHWSVT